MFAISFTGKTKAKILAVDGKSPKSGQKDLGNAVRIKLLVKAPNASLGMIDPTVRGFLYEAGSVKQHQLDATEVVSDLPSLTDAADLIGDINWGGEQTGCKLTIHQGVTGDQTIRLKDGIVSHRKTSHKEGGTVEWRFIFYTTDVDQDSGGALLLLVNREVDIELEAAEVYETQQEIKSDDTPEKAITRAHKGK